MYVWPFVTDAVASSVCLSVGLSVTIVSPAKSVEPIETAFGLWTRVGAVRPFVELLFDHLLVFLVVSRQYNENVKYNICFHVCIVFAHKMQRRHRIVFQRVSRLGFATAATSLNGSQPNFARCLAVSWAVIQYTIYTFIHFLGLLPRNGILPGAEINFASNSCALLYCQRYYTALG